MTDIALRKYYTDFAEIWADLNAVIVAAGWTLYDDVSSADKVYRSNGEEGIFPYIYVRMYYSSTTVYWELYLYWDTGTHAGTTYAYKTGNSLSFVSPAYYCHFVGNKDILGFYTGYSTTSDHVLIGFCNKLFYSNITNLTSGASLGDNVTLTIASSSGIAKGQKLQIVGVNTEGRDQLTVNEVTDANNIIVANLPRDYASGAFLGVTPCPAFYRATNNYYYTLCFRDAAGTENGTSNDYAYGITPITITYIDPEQSSGYYLLTSPYLGEYNSDSLIGYINNDLIKLCPTGAEGDVFAINATGTPEQGTATGGSSNTLSDSAKSWTINEWADKYAVIVDGTGIGQARCVASNTADTLTVVTDWDTNPDATSAYRIVDTVYRLSGYYLYYTVMLEKTHDI